MNSYDLQANELDKGCTLKTIVNITKEWIIPPESRLNVALDNMEMQDKVLQAAQTLELRQTKRPDFKKYDIIAIFGTTGLSQFKIWKNIISFYENNNIQFLKIFLLGADRLVNPTFDSLQIAIKYYPEYFVRLVNDDEILQCGNEMEVMKLISRVIKLPKSLQNIPIISVFSQKALNKNQAETSDSIIQLLKEHSLSLELPILFIGTLPYIKRQGMQAKLLMPQYSIDTAAIF